MDPSVSTDVLMTKPTTLSDLENITDFVTLSDTSSSDIALKCEVDQYNSSNNNNVSREGEYYNTTPIINNTTVENSNIKLPLDQSNDGHRLTLPTLTDKGFYLEVPEGEDADYRITYYNINTPQEKVIAFRILPPPHISMHSQ